MILSLSLLGSLLVGCGMLSPATPAPLPTQDPATYVAAAVKTLGAQMTDEAKRNPSPTPTLAPTSTPTVIPTETPIPATDTPSVPPTATNTTAPALSAQALYAATFPKNSREYVPNEKFGLALGFKNTGTITWPPGFKVVLVGFQGEVTVQKELEMGKAVAPGEKCEFDLWAFGSETLGQHIWYFQLYSPNGAAVPGGAISFYYTSH